MAITENLETILGARYGREVRQAIHDGIKQAYEDAIKNGNANMEVSQARGSYPTLAERLIAEFDGKISKGKVDVADLTQSVKDYFNALLNGISIGQLDNIKGKIDQTFLTAELISQIAGTASINAIPAIGSVRPDMTTFFENNHSVNLYDRNRTRDGYWNTSGVWVDDVNYKTPLDYEVVKPNTPYTLSMTTDIATHLVSWFTSGGVFIKTEAPKTFDTVQTLISPENAGRAYFTAPPTDQSNFTVAEGIVATSDTEYFNEYTLKNDLLNISGITPLMTDFFEIKESANIFDRFNVQNGYINTSGQFVANEGYRVSDTFVPVTSGEQLTFKVNQDVGKVLVHSYADDVTGAWLSTAPLPTFDMEQTITVADGVKYMRFTTSPTTLDTMTVARGTVATTSTDYYRRLLLKSQYLPNSEVSSVAQVDKLGTTKTVNSAIGNETIQINTGTYLESVDLIGKHTHLVGIDKNSTIIRTENSSRETPPLEMTSGSVSNLTLYANWPEGMTRPTDGRTPYGAHIDYDQEANKTLVFEDCDISSDWNAGVGIGMRTGFNLVFRRCRLHSNADGLGGVFFHDSTNDSLRGESWITFEDCTITSKGRHALSIQAQGTEADIINCKFVRCLVYSEKVGTKIDWVDNANSVLGATVDADLVGTGLFGTKNFRLTPDSYGNNLAYLNA